MKDKHGYVVFFQTCQPVIKENLETHEKKSGDSTKSSEILFFSPIKIKQTLFRHFDPIAFPRHVCRMNLQTLLGNSAWNRSSVNG